MRLMRLIGISLTAVFVCCSAAAPAVSKTSPSHAATPLLWGDLKPGPFAVGFETIYARDKSRPWASGDAGAKGGPGRPIRISIWYPAAYGGAGVLMRYGDYFHYDGPADFRAIDDQLEANDRASWLSDLVEIAPSGGKELEAKLFATPVAARRDAPAAGGPFPLLLYSGGEGSRADANVELAEFLASHGYVVATIPELGQSEQNPDLSGSSSDTALHLADFDFALARLRQLPMVDARKLAIAGHSVGGNVALAFAMRHADVRAVIGLDGSYGFTSRSARFKQFPGYAPERIHAPILDLHRADGVQGGNLDNGVLESSSSADRYQVTFRRMFHGDFTEFGTIGLKLAMPLPPNSDGRTRLTGYRGNQAAYRMVLDFLDAQLLGRSTAMRDLASTAAQMPDAELHHASPGTELAPVHLATIGH